MRIACGSLVRLRRGRRPFDRRSLVRFREIADRPFRVIRVLEHELDALAVLLARWAA